MKKILFDTCNGLKNIVLSNSRTKPVITKGMSVVLLLNKVEVHVEIDDIDKAKNKYSGTILGIDNQARVTSGLKIGDQVPFAIENIAYLLDKNQSIT